MNYEILDIEDYYESDSDSVADIPEEYLEEEKYLNKLKMINLFKKDMDKEPEFYGIKNISDGELYNFIQNSGNLCTSNKSIDITEYQNELFDDIYIALFGVKDSKKTYIKVVQKIYKKCYC